MQKIFKDKKKTFSENIIFKTVTILYFQTQWSCDLAQSFTFKLKMHERTELTCNNNKNTNKSLLKYTVIIFCTKIINYLNISKVSLL